MMLQYALEREVTEALGRSYYQNVPATTKEKGRRNGYESHRVLTGEGAVTVQVPQVRETETGFQSKILDAYVSRTEKRVPLHVPSFRACIIIVSPWGGPVPKLSPFEIDHKSAA